MCRRDHARRLSLIDGLVLAVTAALGLAAGRPAAAAWVWVEGEKPVRSTMHRHPWWYDKVRNDLLSGGDLISNFSDQGPGEASYRVVAPGDGAYELWVRANPVETRLNVKVNASAWAPVDMNREASGRVNIAADGANDLRYLAWARAGRVTLRKGANDVRFRMDSPNNNHGLLDCFVFTNEPFTPDGANRPDQLAAAARQAAAENPGWFAFAPPPDPFDKASAIDLRGLNEPNAGDGGFIAVKGGRFVHGTTGEPLRFWGVNGPAAKDPEGLRREARVLAKRGVNLVRVHHGYFDKAGAVDRDAVRQAAEVVAALKAEGIYTHFSIYFPLWLDPAPGNAFLKGYDGKTHAFASLFFNHDFQTRYREWWRALLLTPGPGGRRLIDEPAVAGLEVINEDSYFFWTFDAKNLPDAQLRVVETQFGDWLKAKDGSIAKALRRWGEADPRDDPAAGRAGFRPLWNIANQRTARDKDTARFLAEGQRGFYAETVKYLKGLGFKGVVTASNWVTADARVLGPLEKYTYTPGDFIDRHGYFAGAADGPDSSWAIKEGLVYSDRSALRFDGGKPGEPKQFTHPAMDPHYAGKPSMISETTWNRPNRYRSEAPLFYAAYGALQGSDAVVYFTFDGAAWGTRPGFFVQPWTLMTPALMGQFPAAALIYRKGLVAEGDKLVALDLGLDDLYNLEGTPMPQDAAFDELRLKDVPKGLTLRPGAVIDPLVHLAGRADVRFSERGAPAVLKDPRPYIDRARQTVVSTNGHLRLDYGKGLLTLNAPAAQGVSGSLKSAGTADLNDLAITSPLDLGHVVVVSLDGRPLATSARMLLQVMTEESPTGFRTEPAAGGLRKVLDVGRDPWLVRRAEGSVRFKRPDAATLAVTPLDPNGTPARPATTANAAEIRLDPTTLYYLIGPKP